MYFEHIYALFLFPLAFLALILLQLYRARRRELLAGSLMIWRRVAALETAPRPRRILLDRTFWLQAAALLALALSLAQPSWSVSRARGRHLMLLLDNGPAARARKPDGSALWAAVRGAAEERLGLLGPEDRVQWVLSSPQPRRISHPEGVSPADAARELAERPALSGATAAEAWLFTLESARAWERLSGPCSVEALSVRDAPAPVAPELRGARSGWRTLGPGGRLENVGMVEAGSAWLPDRKAAEVLIQIRNLSGRDVEGTCLLETDAAEGRPAFGEEHRLTLPPDSVRSLSFRVQAPLAPVRVIWKAARGADALPEDDRVTLAPRRNPRPRVRMHGSAPRLMHLYEQALLAEIAPPESEDPVDLEVYVETLPEVLPQAARALLWLAPPQSYGAFEVEAGVLEKPQVLLGEEDPLTQGVSNPAGGLGLLIPQARLLRPAGDLKPLLADARSHCLAGRFLLRDGRPGFVTAFVPQEDLGAERDLPLFALFSRMLLEAAGSGEPYAVRRAAELERAVGEPLPADWAPGLAGEGVLDARASDLRLGSPASYESPSPLPAAERMDRIEFWPWTILAAILLMLLELRWDRPVRKAEQVSAEAYSQAKAG